MTESQIAQNIGRELVGVIIPVSIGLYFGFRALKKKRNKKPKTKII